MDAPFDTRSLEPSQTVREPSRGPIDVVFAADAGYVRQLAVAIASVAGHTERDALRVFVLSGGDIDEGGLRALVPGVEIHVIDLSGWSLAKGEVNNDFLSSATYFRLAIATHLPASVERAIYLDADLVVLGDVRELWNTDMQGRAIAAVLDAGIEGADLARRLALPRVSTYFNAGVLLLDVAQLRRTRALDRAADLCLGQVLAYEDQDALNAIFQDAWTPLDPNWNFQRNFFYDDFAKWKTVADAAPSPKIVHFTTALKPWVGAEWHPLAWLYLRELDRLPVGARMREEGGITWLVALKWRLRYLRWRFGLPNRWRYR